MYKQVQKPKENKSTGMRRTRCVDNRPKTHIQNVQEKAKSPIQLSKLGFGSSTPRFQETFTTKTGLMGHKLGLRQKVMGHKLGSQQKVMGDELDSQQKVMGDELGPPQKFFLKQPHEGELESFCGYYALCNYYARELDLNAFRDVVYAQYRKLEIPDEQIRELVASAGTGMEGIAVNEYKFRESKDAQPGIDKGRFMASTYRYRGHWLTYIRDVRGQWWEYDSWKGGPGLIGTEEELRKVLKADTMSNIYYD